MVWWPNGKALLSGGRDCGFESHPHRFCLVKLQVLGLTVIFTSLQQEYEGFGGLGLNGRSGLSQGQNFEHRKEGDNKTPFVGFREPVTNDYIFLLCP
jgi:hypothetical protein